MQHGQALCGWQLAGGDRVIARDAQATGVPSGTVRTVVQVFARLPEICDVQLYDYAERCAVLTNALAPVPMLEATPSAGA